MSLWRWTQISSFSGGAKTLALAMALAVLGDPATVAAAASPTDSDSTAPQISSGPVSSEEAAILWKDGQADFEHGLDEDAVPKLERFIARYPGYPGYVEAHHVLGRAYMRLHQPGKAKPLLKEYIQARGKAPEAIQARLELGRADLELSQYPEALLIAEEALRLAPNGGKRPPGLESTALVLKAQALLGLGHDDRARQAVVSAENALPKQGPAPVRGEIQALALELKLRQCSTFPSRGRLDEAQVRDQLERRGNCLLESLLIFRKVLMAGDTFAAEAAGKGLDVAYSQYWDHCRKPPAPTAIRPRDRTAQQQETYFREMAVVLEQDCRQKTKQGAELMSGWHLDAPNATGEALKKTIMKLDKFNQPHASNAPTAVNTLQGAVK